MITEGFFGMLQNVYVGMLGVLPDSLTVPGYFSTSFDAVFSLLRAATTLSVWVPVPFALAVISFRLFVVIAGGAVKAGRLVLSLFTGGGGSAA